MSGVKRQLGLTLVELMVAMVISLVLLAGVLHLFSGVRQSQRVQEQLSRVQERGRFAMEILGRELRKAGYRPSQRDEEDKTVSFVEKDLHSAAGEGLHFAAGQVIAGDGTRVAVRYYGSGDPADGLVTDCLGTDLAENEIAVATFALDGGSMQCTVENETSGATPHQMIADNVEELWFKYGEDTDNDNYANQYVKAADVGDWTRVRSVRVCIRLRTDEPVADEPVSYTDYCSDSPEPVRPDDQFLRRTYRSVISLRNVLP